MLTCSTYPLGPGVKLELSANADMWTVSFHMIMSRCFLNRGTLGGLTCVLRSAAARVYTAHFRADRPYSYVVIPCKRKK